VETTGASRERQRLIRKLESIADLTAEEKQALLALPMTVKELDSHVDVVREHDRPSACCLILEGFLCRYKDLPEGRRQILSFHTPGDIPDLQSLHLKVMDHNLATLVASTVAFIQHDVLYRICDRYPGIARVLWRDTLIDAAIFREWMANLGRRNAKERITHLLCEMALRSKAVGLAKDHSYPFPVTQAELAEVLRKVLSAEPG
jgi:CRP-like cAMP-binding protein